MGSNPNIKKKKHSNYSKLLFYLALPFMCYIFIFSYLPIHGWIYAFFNYKPGIPLFSNEFVGVKFFTMMFETSTARGEIARVMANTIMLSFLNFLCSPLPIVFAIFLSQFRSVKYKRFVQTATTLPNFISWVLVYTVFFSMFSYDDGMINKLGNLVFPGWKPFNPLGNGEIVWGFQTAVSVWKSLGWTAIIYLAAITSIDKTLYDAAKVDGANRMQSIWHITVPGIIPTYFVILILSISNMLNNGFEQYLVFQNPTTKNSLEVLDLYVYNQGIANIYYSYATAVGIMKTFFSILLFAFANRLSKVIRGYSIF